MKKASAVAAALIALSMIFTACGKKATVDQYGWYHDFDDAKKVAKKQSKNILLLISMDGDDDGSKTLKKDIFDTNDFRKNVSKDFVLVNLDFSKEASEEAKAPANATDKEQKSAEKKAALLKKNMKVASMYNVQTTPAVFIVTKDGYYIAAIEYDSTVNTAAAYIKVLTGKAADIKTVTDLVKTVHKTSGIEEVKAIDKLFEATRPEYQLLLADLCRSVPELDKKNESGLVGKYVMAAAYADASGLFRDGNYVGASKIFSDAAVNKYLKAEDKMQAYYTAAYLLGSSGSTDYPKMLELLQKSYDAAPDKESDNAKQVKNTLEMVKKLAEKAVPSTEAPAEKGKK
jgi:thioredoxin-related protein